MLRVPNLIGEEKADKIVTEFVNYRLLEIMEDIILDEVVWGMAMRGELDESASTKSFDELVDLKELMLDDQFAAAVSMMYLPENYPLNKANKKFFGLYKLLRAKKEYVPDLAMEYILYSILESEVGEVDMINQDMEDGLFDDLEDGMFDGFDEDFDEDFEDDEDDFFGDDFDDEEELSTVERIPEPDRTVVKKAVLEAYKGEFEGKELEETAEYLVNCYEDLREYLDVCFWDTDFLFLDDFTDHIGSVIKEFEVNQEQKVVLKAGTDIVCKNCPNNEGGVCTTQDKVLRYDASVLRACGLSDGSEMSFAEFIWLVKDKIIDEGIRGDICGDCSWDYICREKKSRYEESENYC